MNKVMEQLGEHVWEIVHYKYNNSLYMDGIFICDYSKAGNISEYIKAIATHTHSSIDDTPFN